MGVRGLQTFIERDCQEACKNVSLKEKAEEHRKKFRCEPQLVVDGFSFACQWYKKSGLDWIYGGQWLQFKNILNEFVIRFRNVGVELVFFFDGTVCSSKKEEWVKRRIDKYKDITALFCDVKTNLKVTDERAFHLPTSTGQFVAFYLKELGIKVYQTDREADDEIVEYAERNRNVFGILSQDSDFIIYNTKEYFSLVHLDLDSLYTIQYDRHCLARYYLHLDVNQLPLFACLVGNHFMPFEKLRQFHRRLIKGKIYIAAIATSLTNLIINKNWSGDPYDMNQIRHISQYVFRNESGMKMIQDGLKSYIVGQSAPPPLQVLIEIPENIEKDLYKRHIDCSQTQHIFNLLCKLQYYSSEVLEDISAEPSALIYREIRQRGYGILFDFPKTLPHGKAVLIEEYCAYQGNTLEKPELVTPLPLKKLIKGGRLTLTDIRYSFTEAEKYQVFWSIMQLPMDYLVLMKIPKHLLVFSCIINFLIGESTSKPRLKPSDVAIFVAQAVWEKTTSQLNELQVPWVDDKAINLSTLFVRGVTMVLMVLGICDYPFPATYAMPWNFFDGKLFHYLYTKAKQRCTVYDLCQNQSSTTQQFYYLLRIVTSNTIYDFNKFDWKNVLVDFEC